MDWDRIKKFFANKLGKGERCHVLKYGVLDTRFQYQGQILCVCVCVFNWRKIALQCCVGFCHKTSQISRYYTHLPSFSSFPPSPKPLWFITEPGWAPYVTQQRLTSYLFTPGSVYMSMLLSLFIPLSPSLTASTNPFFLYEGFGLPEHSGWMVTERQIPPGCGSHDLTGVIQDPLAIEDGLHPKQTKPHTDLHEVSALGQTI